MANVCLSHGRDLKFVTSSVRSAIFDIVACPPSRLRMLVNFARWFGCRRNYSQSMKEMEYVSREGYLQEELFTELIAPGFLIQTIYVDINFLLFSPSLLLLPSIMTSCVETFEVQVMYLCLLTVLRAFL